VACNSDILNHGVLDSHIGGLGGVKSKFLERVAAYCVIADVI